MYSPADIVAGIPPAAVDTVATAASAPAPTSAAPAFSPELSYIVLLFALFVVPRFLQRYRLPSAVTSIALGAIAGMGFGLFTHDPTVDLLATLGIVALFLFAGLDVEFAELRREAPVLAQHVLVRVVALVAVAYGMGALLGLPARPAFLVALALLTPSAGFILDAVAGWGLGEREIFWVKSKAIASELVALVALFVTLQSETLGQFAVATLVLAGLIAVLPFVFRVFAARIVPHAPKSEFAFLLMVAVVAAFATRRLGVYYLVGAFVVGITAQRFRERLPALASEQMLHAVEVFASFFVPFYFFRAGLHLRRADFGPDALVVGVAFLGLLIPLRFALIALHRRLVLRERLAQGLRVAVPLLPTLVFTLVIAEILRDRYDVSRAVFGGLILYTLVNTVIPGFALRLPPLPYDAPHVPALEVEGPTPPA
jgi:Kef-type K+ transport system membrane component KefB